MFLKNLKSPIRLLSVYALTLMVLLAVIYWKYTPMVCQTMSMMLGMHIAENMKREVNRTGGVIRNGDLI